MDFFFDNIAVFALIFYGLAMFAFKKLQASGEDEEDAQTSRHTIPRRPQYHEKKKYPNEHQAPTFAEEYSISEKTINPHPADAKVMFKRQTHSARLETETETEEVSAEHIAYETHTSTKSFDEAFGNEDRVQKQILEMLADRNNLKRAVIASEIIGKPVALRDQHTGI